MKVSGSPSGLKVSATLAMYVSLVSATFDLARRSRRLVVPGDGTNSLALADFAPSDRYAARLVATDDGRL
jgi:hypothetical protein